VIRGCDPGGPVAVKEFAAMFGKSEIAAKHGLGGRGTHADDDFGFDDENFGVKPGLAGFDLAPGRLFVKAPLAARLPTEVFYGIGDVDIVSRNTGLFQRIIEQPASGADEGFALLIFFVAGHFA